MTTVLTMDITDGHGKSCFSRTMRARARLGKWEVRKWNYFEELHYVEKERKKATDRGCMSGILLLLREI